MPVQLDIAGNFAAGQKATLDRRRARQMERVNDYGLAAAGDEFQARRSDMGYAGWNPEELAPLQTNQDPLLFKLMNWWKQKRANRVLPSNMMPEQVQSVGDEMNQLGFDGDGFKNGGKVRAIPHYAEGGDVATEEEMIRRRAAANRARAPAEVASRTETAIPVRPGMIARAGSALRAGVNSAGKKFAPIALGATAVENYNTDTERYRQRFGMAPGAKETGFWGDVGARALGAASDLGDVLTFGQAGKLYRDNQQQAAQPRELDIGTQPGAVNIDAPAAIPKTPDEAIAQQAISEGTKMAEDAKQQSAPPGAIDFSQTDIDPGEIPNMTVGDWVDYRKQALKSLTARGMPINDALQTVQQSVTKMQQQGFMDYGQQALMHMQRGDMKSAGAALRAAYQYFPNGSDVRFGSQQGKDGQPVLVAQGFDEKSNEPKGQPMIMNAERLATMLENFSKPDAFRAWTKDWRDEQFNRQKFNEVEKPKAESEIRYQNRAGRAALMTAEANQVKADRTGVTGDRKQVDLDRANAAFVNAVELLGIDDQAQADRLMSVMSQIYEKSNWQYPQVIEFVRQAQTEGRLDEVAQALGLEE